MQFQADILDRPVEVAKVVETTARGAALLAGRGIGLWRSEKEINSLWQASARYEPSITESERMNLRSGWSAAIERSSSIT
jgi:glycerol kinase